MSLKTNQCTGECCQHFTLRSDFKTNPPDNAEGAFIASMIVHIKESVVIDKKAKSVWTCKHYDTETKLCGIYDDPCRPKMCSGFPYDGICGMCGVVGPEVSNTDEANISFCCDESQEAVLGTPNVFAGFTVANLQARKIRFEEYLKDLGGAPSEDANRQDALKAIADIDNALLLTDLTNSLRKKLVGTP